MKRLLKLRAFFEVVLILVAILLGVLATKSEELLKIVHSSYDRVYYEKVVRTYITLDSLKYNVEELSPERVNIETFSVAYSEYLRALEKDKLSQKSTNLYELLMYLNEQDGLYEVNGIYIPENDFITSR